MADQSYEDVVIELSFNIENPQAIPPSASFDDTFGLSRDMLTRALVEYLDGWREQTRLLPKQGAGRTSCYVFRKPTALDEIKLVETTYFVTDLFLKTLAGHAKAGELDSLNLLDQSDLSAVFFAWNIEDRHLSAGRSRYDTERSNGYCKSTIHS